MQKDVPQTPRFYWEQKAHTVASEFMQAFYNLDSRKYVLLLGSVGGLALPLLVMGEFFHWGSLQSYLRFSICTTDFAGVDVLEEPHEFVFYLCHYLSLNILPWVTRFLRGMNINVELLLAQSFYQSYVFSRVFFCP